jgi:hypothetical protein
MYDAIYDEKHRFYIHSVEANDKSVHAQKGLREQLLCDESEQKLGRYERYISLVMQGKADISVEQQGQLIIVRGIDYRLFRLFQLSILWRAGVARQAFFSQVSLGPHEEQLRHMLLSEHLGESWQYGCLMFAMMHEGKMVEDVMLQPTPSRVTGVAGYRFVFGGHLWAFMVTGHKRNHPLEGGSLLPTGEMRVLLTDIMSMTFLTRAGEKLIAQGKV